MAKPPTKNIYFTRHGERLDWIDKTWAKTAERRLNTPLSPKGLQQADELGEYVAKIQPRITHIYASPFLRTIQTALQVAKYLNRNISSPNELTKIRLEPGYGEFLFWEVITDENELYQSLDKIPEISENLDYFDRDYESVFKDNYFTTTEKEDRQRLRDRLKHVSRHILDAHTNDCNILIVTHAATLIEGVRAIMTVSKERNQEIIKKEEINAITNNHSEWDMSPIRAGVCSLTHLELMDDQWTVSKNGLASYLSKGEQNVWMFPDDTSLYKTSQ